MVSQNVTPMLYLDEREFGKYIWGPDTDMSWSIIYCFTSGAQTASVGHLTNDNPNNIPHKHHKGFLVKISIFNHNSETILALNAKYFCYFKIMLRTIDDYIYVINDDEIIHFHCALCLQGVFLHCYKFTCRIMHLWNSAIRTYLCA